MKLRHVAGWIAANLVLWLGATTAFGLWIAHAVREEYRLGYRTTTHGDTIAIPIVGFALSFGVLLVGLNVLLLIARLLRRSRGSATRQHPSTRRT